MKRFVYLTIFVGLLGVAVLAEERLYSENPFVIQLEQEPPEDTAGGIALGDLDNDGRLDYIVTTSKTIGAYSHDGKTLWVRPEMLQEGGSAENIGLPGHCHPRVEVHDIDGDGKSEILYLQNEGEFVIADAATGKIEKVVYPKHPETIDGWQAFTVCNLRGKGDQDIVFQACPITGPCSRPGQKRGTHVAAFAVDSLEGEPLWLTKDFFGLAHGPLRVADLDGDGKDEICGVTIVNPDGSYNSHWKYTDRWDIKKHGSFHADSIFIYDVRPDEPGLEAVILEEGANAVSVVNLTEYLWRIDHRRQEPQNAAIGEFDLSRPGLEIWCRSRYNVDQKPWVMDAKGNVISEWEMTKKAPKDWTRSGVEIIWTIDWTGGVKQLACAKERHKEGKVAIFDPMTGEFVRVFDNQAYRLMVADVCGDWREEILVQGPKELRIYWNDAPNPRPNHPRLWTQNHYRRSKANYNYYSP